MALHHVPTKDVEVSLKNDPAKAIIEGKTSVPFQAFVKLILQRKVFSLFKEWQDEPVILSSELLTDLASAQQDSHENRTHLLLVTLAVGMLCGVALLALLIPFFAWLGITIGTKELLIIAACIIGGGVVLAIFSQMQSKAKTDKVTDALEKVAGLLK